MTYEEKKAAYLDLVTEIRNGERLSECNSSSVSFEACKKCEEINLWTYWQGGIDCLDAEIVLMGQDWGTYDQQLIDEWIPYFENRRKLSPEKYPHPKVYSKADTDYRLVQLFKSIDPKLDIQHKIYHNLFFTNFILYYRSPSSENSQSGGNINPAMRIFSHYNARLMEIIEPKVVICLGRSTFDSTMKALGYTPPKGNYNTLIEHGELEIKIAQNKCVVFPVAHPGGLGVANRNRGKTYNDPLDIQRQDWNKIGIYLKKHEISII
ncbi:MAG: hypothetical protein J6I96_06100 [Oscillospiraceae bacterium]|nr:hypothetical protein [Oscillospiraceae bacterium]